MHSHSTLPKAIFSNLARKYRIDTDDFRISATCAALTLALSASACFFASDTVHTIAGAVIFLIQFPLPLFENTLLFFANWTLGLAGVIFVMCINYAISFLVKILMFYALTRYTKPVVKWNIEYGATYIVGVFYHCFYVIHILCMAILRQHLSDCPS